MPSASAGSSSDPSWAEASTRPAAGLWIHRVPWNVPIPHGRKHLPGRQARMSQASCLPQFRSLMGGSIYPAGDLGRGLRGQLCVPIPHGRKHLPGHGRLSLTSRHRGVFRSLMGGSIYPALLLVAVLPGCVMVPIPHGRKHLPGPRKGMKNIPRIMVPIPHGRKHLPGPGPARRRNRAW